MVASTPIIIDAIERFRAIAEEQNAENTANRELSAALCWTNTGAEMAPPERREDLAGMFRRLEWHSPAEKRSEAMAPALAIKQCTKEFRLRLRRYAISNEMAPYGLYGVEFFSRHPDDKRPIICRLFVCDRGSDCVPLASYISQDPAPEETPV
jgi:hypothetical protein